MKARTKTASTEEINTTTSTPVEDTTTEVATAEDDIILLDRNTYKSIKKMDRGTLEGLIQDIYENGRKKGMKEATSAAVDDSDDEIVLADAHNSLDLRELEKSIKNVKGVGEKRAEEIMGIIEA